MNLSAVYEMNHQPVPPEARDSETADLRRAAGDDWPTVAADPELLAAFRALVECNQTRRAGRRPAHWTQATECKDCGCVWLWPGAPARVLGCPWCFNRASGLPIPRPPIFNPNSEGDSP